MAINTGQIKALLEPGLYKVDGKYPQLDTLYSKVFKKQKAKLATERMARMRYLGLAAIKTEGGSTAFDNNAGFRYYFNATTIEVSLGFVITRKAIDDNLYKEEFSQNSMGLPESFRQFKETLAWNIFNNCTTYDATIGGDGVALASTAHPIDGGTWANTFTIQQDLNEASLLQASVNIQNTYVDEAGLKIDAYPEKLIVPITLGPVAERLLKSELRPGTSNNDVNVITSYAGGIKDYMQVRYLSSAYSWFLTTNIEGLVMLERVPFETSMWTDDATDNLLVKGYERYIPSYYDPRAIWASTPTS